MRVTRSRPVFVRRAPKNRCEGRLALGHEVRRAALGRGGILALKREGDGGTPLGRFPVRQVLYRADRVPRPRTLLPVRAIRDHDGWCDDPADPNYNRLVRQPSRRSAEGLKRAIFVHLARPGLKPTDGCIALSRRDLTMLLARLSPRSAIVVGA